MEAKATADMQNSCPARPGRPGAGRLRALVIDDSTFDLRLVTRHCKRLGIDVTCARSAAEARARLDGGGYDLLLVDHALGAATGFDVLAALDGHPALPRRRILLTGNDDPRIAAEAAAQGLGACLPKSALGSSRMAALLRAGPEAEV
ncbi:response regulator [Pseudooceanicola sp.]|uniref:response regulator n=1 Tax=Pseudooceanicola sp. TaxID=1914328 RepID=UPI0035125C40